MASVSHEVLIETDAAHVWDVIRDVGMVHKRLLPRRVAATRLEGDQRILTYPDGREVREAILDIDDKRMRLAYSVLDGDSLGLTYHHASFQVVPDGIDLCRLVWVTDLLPHHLVDAVRARVVVGASEMRLNIMADKQRSQPD